MYKQRKIHLLFLLVSLALILISGCIAEDNYSCSDTKESFVRILTTIDVPTTFSGNSKTRLAGTVDETNSDYTEGTEDGNSHENALGTVRVIAFNLAEDKVAANILFRAPGSSVSGEEKIFEYADGIMTHIQLDLKILSGTYKFVLIANEETLWNLSAISSYSSFVNSTILKSFQNPILDAIVLESKVDNQSGIPMVGEAEIHVVPQENATASNPQLVTPTIQLKRTIAKVEVYLRNTDDNDVVYESASLYKIKSVSLKNVNQKYNVLVGDNTTITENLSNILRTTSHNEGAPFNANVFSGYIAERKNVGADNPTLVEVVVDAAGQEYTFEIPIYQKKHGTDEKDYQIYRNTIYRLGLILKGNELVFTIDVYTTVEGWKNETIAAIELPIEDYINIDKRTIYLGTDLNGSFSEQIKYYSNLNYIEVKSDLGANLVVTQDATSTPKVLNLSIQKSAFTVGETKTLRLVFGKGESKILEVVVLVKAKIRP